MASAAFLAWRAARPGTRRRRPASTSRSRATSTTQSTSPRGRTSFGIHIFPNSNWPFTICFGLLFLGLAAIPFASTTRIILAVIGGLIFLYGVVGWVVLEDVQMFPSDGAEPGAEVHH